VSAWLMAGFREWGGEGSGHAELGRNIERVTLAYSAEMVVR
jgi:hypothetical protein